MAGESDEPGSAAARLEAALERIAAVAARRESAPTTRLNVHQGVQSDGQPSVRSSISSHVVEVPVHEIGAPGTGTPETGTPERPGLETGRLERGAPAAGGHAAGVTGLPASAIPSTENGLAGPGATGMIATRMAAADTGTPVAAEIVARLDGLIERLRGALAVRPG